MDPSEEELKLYSLVILAVVLFPVMIYIFGFHYETGKGNHSGYITAVQKQGIVFKTWRAYVKTDISSSQEDKYCIETEEVAKKLEEMSENKEKGTFQYKSYIGYGITLCDGEGDMIYGVK